MKRADYERVSLSRLGWLGRVRDDPGALPDRGWNQREEPTDAELRALEHDDDTRRAA